MREMIVNELSLAYHEFARELARLLPRQQPSQRSMKVPQFRLGRWPYGEQVLEFLCPLLSLGYAEIWVDAKSLVADVELRLQFLSPT